MKDTINKKRRAQMTIEDTSNIKYDVNEEYDIAFGKEYEANSGFTESYTTESMALDKRLNALADIILAECIDLEAIDIQIMQLDSNHAYVRAKLGTVMRSIREIDVRAINGLVQVFKRRAGMSTTPQDSKLPQDGRITLKHHGEMYSLRVNTVPAHFVEVISMRVLRNSGSGGSLDDLGMPENVVSRLRKVIQQSEGMIILSGATGTGKALTTHTPIETNSGLKEMGTLTLNDFVLDVNGLWQRVLGVYPQGVSDVWHVKLSDGQVIECDGEHQWTIVKAGHHLTFNTDELFEIGQSHTLPQTAFGQHEIIAIEPTSITAEMVCIEVDSEDKLFLVHNNVPTHNTTTMYTALREIIRNTKGQKNIHTIENPIETIIPYTNQLEVNEAVGFTFEKGIKALLRQNPDIILIGEIRDESSAKTSLRAATSGHLLFTTVHANDALSVPHVLTQYGLKKSEISDALQLVLNQRIVSKLCENCRKTIPLDTDALSYIRQLGLNADFLRIAKRNPDGCEVCAHTGYHGKVMVVEMLDANRRFGEILHSTTSDYELKEQLRLDGSSYYSKEQDVARHLKEMSINLRTAENIIR